MIGVIRMVEEVDVDSVGVVGRADWSDGLKRLSGLAPAAAGHGGRVID